MYFHTSVSFYNFHISEQVFSTWAALNQKAEFLGYFVTD